MEHPGFFKRAGPFSLADIAKATGAELAPGAGAADTMLEDVRTLTDAGPHDLTFFNNRKYADRLKATQAGACLVLPAFAARVPATTGKLVTADPYRGFAQALTLFYPESRHAQAAPGGGRDLIDPSAELEEGVVVEPGAVIAAEARIGRGTRIAAGAVIGYRVTIGRDSHIGPLATVAHALVGDRVIIHSGVRIGQDGFGFAMSARGHLKVPQIGRVVIQDDVEIGANSTIDRGALKDTIIGEGTKIDNLVQIGHNAVIGRHCVLVGAKRGLRLDRARRFRHHGRPIRRHWPYQDRHRRPDRRHRSPDQGCRAGGPHRRHARAASDPVGPGNGPAGPDGQARREG